MRIKKIAERRTIFLSATHERASDAVMRFLGFEENCPTTGILDFVGSDGASWEVVTERVVNCAEINSMAAVGPHHSTEPARPARRRAHALVDFHADHQAPDLRGGGVGEGGVSEARARSLFPPLPPLRCPPRHFGAARGASSQSLYPRAGCSDTHSAAADGRSGCRADRDRVRSGLAITTYQCGPMRRNRGVGHGVVEQENYDRSPRRRRRRIQLLLHRAGVARLDALAEPAEA